MTCAIAGAAGDEKASGPWKCYVAIFEAPVLFPMYIIMCLFPFQQVLYQNPEAIFPAAEISFIPFSRSILRIFAMYMKINTLISMASSILTE